MDSQVNVEKIKLKPFMHQVSGHSSMFLINEDTVCKPLIERELRFYKNVPESLKCFLPDFRGVIKVTILEDKNGFITLFTNISKHDTNILEIKTNNRMQLLANSNLESNTIQISTNVEDSLDTYNNPWVSKCFKNNIHKLVESSKLSYTGQSQNFVVEFIILENLTSRYHQPCVLDLKMGVRLHGDDASQTKISSQNTKVKNTTSGKIGLRISGMQVYRLTNGNYLYRDKYYGRSLSVSSFKDAVRDFLYNGFEFRYDVLCLLIKKLTTLKEVLTKLDSFRFFSSSLLILYEGCDKSKDLYYCDICKMQQYKSTEIFSNDKDMSHIYKNDAIKENCVDVRIIDFAHSTHKNLDDPKNYKGPDNGFLFGLDNFISLLHSLNLNSK